MKQVKREWSDALMVEGVREECLMRDSVWITLSQHYQQRRSTKKMVEKEKKEDVRMSKEERREGCGIELTLQ